MALEILRAHVLLSDSAGKLKRTAVTKLAAETLVTAVWIFAQFLISKLRVPRRVAHI